MRIANNIPALQALGNMNKTNSIVARAMNNMTSGKKINSAKDDAAGLAIANKLRVQIEGLEQASQNSMDGISLLQTAEGALGEIHSMLQRIRELAVQAANGTNEEGDNGDRKRMMDEVEALKQEITDTAKKTEYNKIKVLSGELWNEGTAGGFFNDLTLQIGANSKMEINISIPKVTANTLGYEIPIPDDGKIYTLEQVTFAGATEKEEIENCSRSIEVLDKCIADISDLRSYLGATQNRLECTVSSIDTTSLNTVAARSRLEDTDMAKEMTLYSSQNVLSQAATSILAQANQRPQQILQLIG